MSTQIFNIDDLKAAYEDGWTCRNVARYLPADGGNPSIHWPNSATLRLAMVALENNAPKAPSSSESAPVTMTVPLEIPVDHPAIMLASALSKVVHYFQNSTYPLNQSEIESAFYLAATVAVDKDN